MNPAAADKAMSELTASFSDNVFNFTHFAMSIWARGGLLRAQPQ